MRAAVVCAAHGCPNAAVKQGRCIEHARGGTTRQWRKRVAQVLDRDKRICWLCGKPGATTADHIRRVRDGGTDELRNLRAAHVTCNLKRG